MFEEFGKVTNFNIGEYFNELATNPWEIVTLVLDLVIVIFLLYCFVKISKKSRVWQLIKGIAFLIVFTLYY